MLLTKIVRKNFRSYSLVQVGIFKRTKLGPDNIPYLDQIITPQNVFLLLNMCQNTFLTVFFEHQPNFGGKRQKINDNFSQNTGYIKNVMLQPPLDQQFVCVCFFFYLSFFRNIDVKQKAKLKSRKHKVKEKGFERKRRQTTPNRKDWWKRNFKFSILMLFFSWNKSKETRERNKKTKTRKQNEAKKKEKQEGRKKKHKREAEKEEVKKRGEKRLRRNKGRHWKNKQKCPYLGGKNRHFSVGSKQRKGKKKTKNKEGLRVRWGGLKI